MPGVQETFSRETGSYLFQRYTPKEYVASPQNWSVAQDRRGVMYFGNSDGVLEFDGVTWKVTPVPNRSIVRSVAVDERGTIYVGAQGDFGFLKQIRQEPSPSFHFSRDCPRRTDSFQMYGKSCPRSKGCISVLSAVFSG